MQKFQNLAKERAGLKIEFQKMSQLATERVSGICLTVLLYEMKLNNFLWKVEEKSRRAKGNE